MSALPFIKQNHYVGKVTGLLPHVSGEFQAVETVMGSWVRRPSHTGNRTRHEKNKGWKTCNREISVTLTTPGKLLVLLPNSTSPALISPSLAGMQRQDFNLGFEFQRKQKTRGFVLFKRI